MQDANFNVTGLINTSRVVQERYTYDAYGKISMWTAAWATRASSSFVSENLFAGYRQDSETGLQLARNRFHHATLGRWVSRDPLSYSDSLNLYEYCRSNSLGFVDWSGFGMVGVVGVIDPNAKDGGKVNNFIKDNEARYNFISNSAKDFYEGLKKRMDDCLAKNKDNPGRCCFERIVIDGHKSAKFGGGEDLNKLSADQIKELKSWMCKGVLIESFQCRFFVFQEDPGKPGYDTYTLDLMSLGSKAEGCVLGYSGNLSGGWWDPVYTTGVGNRWYHLAIAQTENQAAMVKSISDQLNSPDGGDESLCPNKKKYHP